MSVDRDAGPGDDAMERRLAEIEAKLALNEDLVEALNRSVFRQQQVIEALQIELRALRERQASSEADPPFRSLRDEIPPHY